MNQSISWPGMKVGKFHTLLLIIGVTEQFAYCTLIWDLSVRDDE